jgi:density-regulated protein DRP1
MQKKTMASAPVLDDKLAAASAKQPPPEQAAASDNTQPATTAENTDAAAAPQARSIVYCGICSLPPEYCEFGGTVAKCTAWLLQHHPAMHAELYSADEVAAGTGALNIGGGGGGSNDARAERDASKKAAKAEARAAAADARRRAARVLIRRVERNRRKCVTAVSGLEAHGLDVKRVAKDFGKRFATGSSVTKSAAGGGGGGGAGGSSSSTAGGGGGGGGGAGAEAADEIVVQGDLSDEIYEWIREHYAEIPAENIDLVDDRKKKGGG